VTREKRIGVNLDECEKKKFKITSLKN